MSRRVATIGLLLASVALAPPAYAEASPQDRAAADALYEDAGKLAAANRWAEAIPKLEASLKLDPGIGTLLRLGDAYEKIGKTASAWATFNDAVGVAQKANDPRIKHATEGVKRLEPNLARLTIEVAPENAGAGLEVRRDGTALSAGAFGTPVPVDPGAHVFEATQPGKQRWTTTITIEPKPGVTTVRVPALADATPEDKGAAGTVRPFWSTQRIAGLSTGAVGVAGLAVGSILGGLTLAKVGTLKSGGHCHADLTACDAIGQPLRQDARTMAHGSTAALVVGAAALVTGIVVFVVTPSGSVAAAPKSGARVIVGPVAGAALTGMLVRGGW